jgi:HK97 family phage portal protein
MALKDLFKRTVIMPEVKNNPVGDIIYADYGYQAPTRNLEYYYKDGYQKNSIVYKCVNLIADSVSDLDPYLCRKDAKGNEVKIEKHPLLDLLERPNPLDKNETTFVKKLMIDYLVTGMMVVARDEGEGEPKEMWRINPKYLKVKEGKYGLPAAYQIQGTKGSKDFAVDAVTGKSNLFVFARPHPNNEFLGLSPLDACAAWVDVLNNAAEWNASILENSGSQSGIITIKGNGVSQEAIARFVEEYKKRNTGSKKAGQIAVFPVEADFKSTSTSPKDMDFSNAVLTASRAIADAYGVPFPLISPEAATFNNQEQAIENFFEQTVCPIADEFFENFGTWLMSFYKDTKGMELEFYEEDLPSMEAKLKREADKYVTLVGSGIVTRNEAREALGYEKLTVPLANELFVGSGQIPLTDAGVDTSEVDAALNSMEDGNQA